jgi:hypothetical protein
MSVERDAIVINNNEILSCGGGMVIFDGHQWKNIQNSKVYLVI